MQNSANNLMKLARIKFMISLILMFSLLSLFINKRAHHKSNVKHRIHSHFHTKSKYLSQFFSQRATRDDDDLPDPELISEIKIISGKEGASCPYPMNHAKGCNGSSTCDLNQGLGGKYIYICLAKKKISEFSKDDNLITTIKLNVNNKDCGNLKVLESSIKNSWIGSDYLYFCIGEEENLKPIKNIKIFFGKENIPENCRLELSPGKYLCIEYEDKAPRKIEFSEINMLTSDDNFKSLGKPETLVEIDNDNGSAKDTNTIKRSTIITQSKSSAWNIENKYGAKVDAKMTVGTKVLVGGKASASTTVDTNWSKNKGEVDTKTETTQIDFSCIAPREILQV